MRHDRVRRTTTVRLAGADEQHGHESAPTAAIHILKELQLHLPYTVLSALLGLVILAVAHYAAVNLAFAAAQTRASEGLFHVFHLAHLTLSAAATTAMFRRHASSRVLAAAVGFVGSVGICGASDAIFPFLGGKLLGASMVLHMCVVRHPPAVLVFTFAGIASGMLAPDKVKESSIYSHSGHVVVSTLASMLYMFSFGRADWMRLLWGVFPVLVIGVLLPCCVSDIVFPLIAVATVRRQRPAVKDATAPGPPATSEPTALQAREDARKHEQACSTSGRREGRT